jgi:hypothetical protein
MQDATDDCTSGTSSQGTVDSEISTPPVLQESQRGLMSPPTPAPSPTPGRREMWGQGECKLFPSAARRKHERGGNEGSSERSEKKSSSRVEREQSSSERSEIKVSSELSVFRAQRAFLRGEGTTDRRAKRGTSPECVVGRARQGQRRRHASERSETITEEGTIDS